MATSSKQSSKTTKLQLSSSESYLNKRYGLVKISVSDLTTNWKPGSAGDDWSWADEIQDLMRDAYTVMMGNDAKSIGLDHLDPENPVILGDDGRVWDGHHRVCLAIVSGIPTLMVKMVEKEG